MIFKKEVKEKKRYIHIYIPEIQYQAFMHPGVGDLNIYLPTFKLQWCLIAINYVHHMVSFLQYIEQIRLDQALGSYHIQLQLQHHNQS